MNFSRAKFRTAFTLLELLVAIAIIAILAAVLFPAFSRAKKRAQGALCLNDGKQIMMAMIIYGNDYHDYFPPNPDDGNSVPGYNWCSGDASIGGPDEFNPDVLKDPTRSLLITYLAGNTALFHCPGDQRHGIYQGNDPTLIGQSVSASRTFSMNQAVGTVDPGFDAAGPGRVGLMPHSGIPSLAVNGPWLNNQDTHQRGSLWCTYGKFSSLLAPGPAMTWVLLDEDPAHLNNASFAFGMEYPQWFDVPGIYHNSGCGLAFADGHSEAHKWMMAGPKKGDGLPITDPNDKQDWLWLRARTSAATTGTASSP